MQLVDIVRLSWRRSTLNMQRARKDRSKKTSKKQILKKQRENTKKGEKGNEKDAKDKPRIGIENPRKTISQVKIYKKEEEWLEKFIAKTKAPRDV